MDIIDNSELESLMKILEEMDDEQKAVLLLKELNDSTKSLGSLIMDRDPNLDHEEWKKLCDQAKERVEKVVAEIKQSSS